jgi:hypothetical protein
MGDPAATRRTLGTCRLSEYPGPDSREPPAVSGYADLTWHKKPSGQGFINGCRSSLGRRFEPVPGSHFKFLHLRHPSGGIAADHKTESHRVISVHPHLRNIIDRSQLGGPIESVSGSPFFSLHGIVQIGCPSSAGKGLLSRHNVVHVAQWTHAVTHLIHVMPHGIHALDHGRCLLVNTVH